MATKLVSKQCVDFVKSFEGFSATPYIDCVGVKTLGYGMTGKEIAGLTSVTEAQAAQMLEDLMNTQYATPIKSYLDSKGVKLNQNQFDALVSMAYNIGTAGLLGSTLMKNIVAGVRDVATITANFTAWSKGTVNGQLTTIAGLLRRRQAEAKMFFGTGNTITGSTGEVKKKVKCIVIYNVGADQNSAEILADYLQCPTISNSRKFDYSQIETVYAVGGKKEQYTSYLTKLIAGADRYKTNQAVLDFIKAGGK